MSHPSSRDVHIHNFSLTFHGAELLSDTKLELNNGRRYGLVGLNGSGMLQAFLACTLQVVDKTVFPCEFHLGGNGMDRLCPMEWRCALFMNSMKSEFFLANYGRICMGGGKSGGITCLGLPPPP